MTISHVKMERHVIRATQVIIVSVQLVLKAVHVQLASAFQSDWILKLLISAFSEHSKTYGLSFRFQILTNAIVLLVITVALVKT